MSVQMQPVFLSEKFEKLSFNENVNRSMSQESTENDFEITEATEEDKNDIINLSRRFFNRDEPLNECIGLTGPDGICPELEDYIISTVSERTSVKAVTADGKLVAFSMNGIVNRNDPEDDHVVNDPKFRQICTFLKYNTAKCDLFSKFPDVDKAMSVKIISVDPCMRGRGVATKLMEKTRDIAEAEGCQLMFVECTSYFSALIMKRMGFEKIYTLPYSDYLVDGRVVFNPKTPHSEYTVYVKKL